MAGTETAGFDLVMQFSEDAYQELLGIFFDEGGIINNIVDVIPGVDDNAFTLDIALDRPTDVGLDAAAENPIDIRLGIGEGGGLATVRMVVGINVDRRTEADGSEQDRVQIDFANNIYFAALTVAGINVPIPNLAARLADVIPSLPILPVPVDRDTTSATTIQRADFRVVDDMTGADRDATSAMLTFGGGTPGDAGSLRSIIPEGGRGAIGIFFEWLCRMAVPSLESAFDVPSGSFTVSADRCALNRSVAIGDDGDVTLTSFELGLADGFITVSARVSKGGFCYEATGSMGARIRLAIVDGRLQASVELEDPDVDVDIPWYCWLAAAVVGAAIGGVLVGVIGAIVGGILVPVIMSAALGSIEGTIDDALDSITTAINSSIPDIDVPAFGVNILFQRVFVDDVVIQALLKVESHAPVRAQGVALLRRGYGVDLDTGDVSHALPEADVVWEGLGDGRRLETGCQAEIARTGSHDFEMPRFKLYGYSYVPMASVPLHELGVEHPLADVPFIGALIGGANEFLEYYSVFAVRTNEGRYSLVQAIDVRDDYVRVRYKTFETNVPAVAMVGEFRCLPAPCDRVTAVVFKPAAALVATLDSPRAIIPGDSPAALAAISVEASALRTSSSRMIAGGTFAEQDRDPCDDDDQHPPRKPPSRDCGTVFPVPEPPPGRWVQECDATPKTVRARLEAVTSGTRGEVQHVWLVGGERLADGSSGTLETGGVSVQYAVQGRVLLLEASASAKFELFTKVTVIDDGGCAVSASRCLRHPGKCVRIKSYVPTLTQYRDLMALPEAVVASGVVHLQAGAVQPRPETVLG